MPGHAWTCQAQSVYMPVHACTCLYMPLHAGKCMDMRLYFFLLESPCFPPRKSCAWHMHSVHMACTWRIVPTCTCVNMVSEKKTGRFWGKHSPHPILYLILFDERSENSACEGCVKQQTKPLERRDVNAPASSHSFIFTPWNLSCGCRRVHWWPNTKGG